MDKKRRPIPDFRSEAEERAFWETHDSADYVDWTKAERARFASLKPSTKAISLIPTVIDQNPCAHLRMPRDMIFHGWSMRLFQAWQHSATMSS